MLVGRAALGVRRDAKKETREREDAAKTTKKTNRTRKSHHVGDRRKHQAAKGPRQERHAEDDPERQLRLGRAGREEERRDDGLEHGDAREVKLCFVCFLLVLLVGRRGRCSTAAPAVRPRRRRTTVPQRGVEKTTTTTTVFSHSPTRARCRSRARPARASRTAGSCCARRSAWAEPPPPWCGRGRRETSGSDRAARATTTTGADHDGFERAGRDGGSCFSADRRSRLCERRGRARLQCTVWGARGGPKFNGSFLRT